MPDAKDTGETRVAGTFDVHIALASTAASALPSSFDSALDAAFVELGYTNEDGVTFTDEPTIERKRASQSFYPVRILETARMAKIALALLQWNSDALRAAGGGGTVADAGTGKKFTPHAAGTILEWAIVLTVTDGSTVDRWVLPKASTVSSLETQLNRTELSELPAEFEVIGEDGVDPWNYYTNDTTAFTDA